MTSGMSGWRNSGGSKGFDFGSDDILCSYEDYGNQELSETAIRTTTSSSSKALGVGKIVSGSIGEAMNGGHVLPTHLAFFHVGAGTTLLAPMGCASIFVLQPEKDFHKGRVTRSMFPPYAYSQPDDSYLDVTPTVEKTMKKHVDNLMCFLEGINSKLKSIEKHLQEVHRSVQILRDKQELAETREELAKLQLVHKDSTSSSHSQSTEEKASPPVSDSKKTDHTSEMQNQQLALALPHQVAPPQQPVVPHSQALPQNLTQQSYYVPSKQLSNLHAPAPVHVPQQLPQQVQQQQQSSMQPQMRPPSTPAYPPNPPSQSSSTSEIEAAETMSKSLKRKITNIAVESIQDEDTNELLAIKYALESLLKAERKGKALLIIESNSATAVKWIEDHESRPRKLWGMLKEIDSLISQIGTVVFKIFLKESNAVEDCLVKHEVAKKLQAPHEQTEHINESELLRPPRMGGHFSGLTPIEERNNPSILQSRRNPRLQGHGRPYGLLVEDGCWQMVFEICGGMVVDAWVTANSGSTWETWSWDGGACENDNVDDADPTPYVMDEPSIGTVPTPIGAVPTPYVMESSKNDNIDDGDPTPYVMDEPSIGVVPTPYVMESSKNDNVDDADPTPYIMDEPSIGAVPTQYVMESSKNDNVMLIYLIL
ncbi:Detected protein of unknown function [Hibiscus syriacus]|uniref:RNase H type-1 domain-containing protein n=1 Tax=Hibiscus syriacus TaxID=106335 RepID=A0A6A2ZZU3_HIBSY|nr:Detected protein of unknown function [Hibiscus syriacus]